MLCMPVTVLSSICSIDACFVCFLHSFFLSCHGLVWSQTLVGEDTEVPGYLHVCALVWVCDENVAAAAAKRIPGMNMAKQVH